MKIAVVYNRESRKVINLFGRPNRERIGLKTIRRVVDALKDGGHQVITIEGDKDLISRLEEFMPRVVKGERPGLVFNVSYGIQGQARYSHVPSILEMIGIPYIASGPLAHSLALDKVVTKMILQQHGLPTPDFAVMQARDSDLPELHYPMIVKPKNEAVSFGIKIVDNEEDLWKAAKVIFDEFQQPVLVEQYIEGREINVGLLGNDPPEAFPPVELDFGMGGPTIYTYEDKTGRSGRQVGYTCPAPIGDKLTVSAQKIAVGAFHAIGCYDCARVDMRLDPAGNLYILEINSLPSLGEHGSYLVGAAAVGLDFSKFINRLVEVASARYFGAPNPPQISAAKVDRKALIFQFVTERRDSIEKRLKNWVSTRSRTNDAVGIQNAAKRLDDFFSSLGMSKAKTLSESRRVWTWETAAGLKDGLLIIGNVDVPVDVDFPMQMFRREAEWLHGEGIGSSRAPLVMLEFSLRALRSLRRLRSLPLGVLVHADEGLDASLSVDMIRLAMVRSKKVLVLKPGLPDDRVVTQRRGQRRYRLTVEGEPLRPGKSGRKVPALEWSWSRLDKIAGLSSRRARLSVSTIDMTTERLPARLPHRVTATLIVTYLDVKSADAIESEIRGILGRRGPKWELEMLTERPPLLERAAVLSLYREFETIAGEFEIPLRKESSTWPSVAGLLPLRKSGLCGIAPVARDLRTPQEAVQRISLVQRTILLSQFLLRQGETKK